MRMKWYACLNESALGRYAEHLRVAIRTAIDIAGLEPHVVFDGDPERLRAAIGHDRFQIHRRRSSLFDAIMATPEQPGWRRAVAAGALLRLDIPLIEATDEFVLYTDCDVLFARRVELSALRPRYLAAAPQHEPYDWSLFCSGVLLLNAPAMRSEHPRLMRHAREALGRPDHYDQEILNDYFKNRWDHLPIHTHWKPYWGIERTASIVHFHGPKVEDARRLAAGASNRDVHLLLYGRDPAGYTHYLRFHDVAEGASRRGEPIGAAALAPLRLEAAKVAALRTLRRARHALGEIIAGPAPKREAVAPPPLPAEALDLVEPATSLNFDERSYLHINPDVAAAVGAGRHASGAAHFERHGRYEGRLQMIPPDLLADEQNFDEDAYLARNPDVAFLIARGRYACARDHFERRGRAERRRLLRRPAAEERALDSNSA